MLCDVCRAVTDDLFVCSKQHTLCQECCRSLVGSQCPKCKTLEDNLVRGHSSMTGTIPKNTFPIQFDSETKFIDENDPTRMLNVDEIRKKLRNKFFLEAPECCDSGGDQLTIDSCPDKCVTNTGVSDSSFPYSDTNIQFKFNLNTAKERRSEAIRQSEQLLKDQIISQVFSNWNTSDESCHQPTGIFEERHMNEIPSIRCNPIKPVRLKCDSQPNPNGAKPHPIITKSRSTREHIRGCPTPLALFTPNTIIPNTTTNKRYCKVLGQGDESMQTHILETKKPNVFPTPESNQDIAPEKFVEFIMDKFQNMSLINIKNLLSQLPDPNLLKTINESVLSEWSAKAVENEKLNAHKTVFNETRSLTAFRATIFNDMTTFGEPVMQCSLIEPFEGSVCKSELTGAMVDSIDFEMPRNPIECPISACNNTLVFVSDFTRHIKINHVRVPVEVLRPQTGTNFFVDPTLDEVGRNRCRMLFLVSDKIKDLGRTNYKNYLPVMVMTTLLRLDELFPSSHSTHPGSSQCLFLIWLTGLCPIPNPVHLTLCIWTRRHKHQPDLHRLQSGQLYCIREPQTGAAVFRSGHALVLTTEQCDTVTLGGKSLLELQVMVH